MAKGRAGVGHGFRGIPNPDRPGYYFVSEEAEWYYCEWKAPPTRGEVFRFTDGHGNEREICGRRNQKLTFRDGRPTRCNFAPTENGRCILHGGTGSGVGRPMKLDPMVPHGQGGAYRAERPLVSMQIYLKVAHSVLIEDSDLLSAMKDLDFMERQKIELKAQLEALAGGDASVAAWREAHELYRVVRKGGDTAGLALAQLGEVLKRGTEITDIEERLARLTVQMDKIRERENKRLDERSNMVTGAKHVAALMSLFNIFERALNAEGLPPDVAGRIRATLISSMYHFLGREYVGEVRTPELPPAGQLLAG